MSMDQADPVVEVAIAVRAGDDAVDPLVRRHRNQGGFRRSDTCLPGTRNQAVLGVGPLPRTVPRPRTHVREVNEHRS